MISGFLAFFPVIVLIVAALAISVTLTQASIAKAYTVTNVNVCPSPDSVVALGNWQYENVSVSKKATNIYVTCDEEGIGKGSVYVLSGMPPYPVIGVIPTDVFPRDIAFDTTNHKLYVSVINPRTNTLTYNIPIYPSGPHTAPYGIAYDHLNERVYVTNEQDQSVSVIDGRTDTVLVPRISVEPPGHAYPARVAVDTSNNYIYVPDLYGNEVAVIDGGTNTVIANIRPSELTPEGVTYDTALEIRICHIQAVLQVIFQLDLPTEALS
jgi:YVTN family beta-propeller protein